MSGAPDRPTVVLLHSSGNSPRQWQDFAESMQHDHRVLAVEFHGHGQRPEWGEARTMTLADEAALVLPLVEMAGGAHLVGHSYGGAVAIKLASLRPDLVRSVVAYEPVLFRLLAEDRIEPQLVQDVLQVVHAMRDGVAAGELASAGRAFVEFWSGAGAWDALPERAQRTSQARMPSIVRHFDALFQEPFPVEQLSRLPIPMLFLSGARTTPPARRIAQLLRALLPRAAHEELGELGHLGPITHSRTVNERVRDFLRQPAYALP